MPQQSGLAMQVGLVAEAYVNEVQTITGTASATFGLNFDGALTTVALATTATAAAIATALEALPNIGTGGVTCTGGPLGTAAVVVTFAGPLVSKRNVPLLAVQGVITGLTFAVQTAGTGYGDAVTVTRFLEGVQEGLKLQVERIESKGIRPGNMLARTDRFVVDKTGVEGPLEFEVPTKGFGLILAHAYGADAVITTPATATDTRDQTFTFTDAIFNRSLTIQKGVPDTAGGASNVRPFTYVGCKLTEMELDCAVGDMLMAKLAVDGQDELTNVALASASYASAFENLSFVGGQCTIAGANVDALKASFKLTRNMATSRRFLRSSTKKKEQIPNDLAELSGSIELEFTDLAQYNRFASTTAAGSLAAVTMLWEGSLIEAGFNYGLLITLPQCRFDGDTPTVDGMDLVTVQYDFKVLWDGTTAPTARYRSTDTAQ